MPQFLQPKENQTTTPSNNNVSPETPSPLFCAANLQAAAENSQAAATFTPSQTVVSTATSVPTEQMSIQTNPLPTPNLSVNQVQATQPAHPLQSTWVNQVNPCHSPIQQMFHSALPIQPPSFSPVMPAQSYNTQQVSQPVPMFNQVMSTQSFNNQQVSQPAPMFCQTPSQQQFQHVLPSQSPILSPAPLGQPINSQQVSQPAPFFLPSNPNPLIPGQFFNPQLPPFSFQALPQPPVSTQFNPCLPSQGNQSNVAQGFQSPPTSRLSFLQPPPQGELQTSQLLSIATFKTPSLT